MTGHRWTRTALLGILHAIGLSQAAGMVAAVAVAMALCIKTKGASLTES